MDDLLKLDDYLNEEERLFQQQVAKFVKEQVDPVISDAFEKGTFPTNLIQSCASMGLFGLTLPTEYGGLGASYLAYGLVCQELERGDSGLRSFISVQNSLCIEPIYRFGSDAQKKTYLPAMVKGDVIGCFGLTEPDSGSDPASMKTHAKKVKGGYELNGSKLWITNAPIADLAIVWAKTEDGIRGFLVPKETHGFTRIEIHHKMSLRASFTGELVFEQAFIPDANLLPGSTIGLRAALHCLNQARFGISWGSIGAAMACFDITQDYLLTRKQFEKPLASFQLVQDKLTDMYSAILKAQCLNLRVTQLKQAGADTPTMISLIKRNACREALWVARTCRNLLGANGISLEYHVIRHLLNLESVFTYEGTDHIHTLVLGKHITGIDAFH
ncbi:MAG: acyl-CoA dehydrogenase family protein [Gammaproteobacteria bacterium]|nr:acyl-CoA dehydrogenase family protein [Gammaproteobacteria bacterium]